MFRKFALCITAVVFGAGLLLAHGDELTGTVTAITKDLVTIKDAKDNKTLIKVMLDSKTKYMMGTKAAKMTDVKVGEKVAIDAQMDTKMKMYVAESVTLPAAAKAAAAVDPAARKAGAPAPKPATTTTTTKPPASK